MSGEAEEFGLSDADLAVHPTLYAEGSLKALTAELDTERAKSADLEAKLAEANAALEAATKPAASAPGTGKDKALEEKKAQAEAAEAAKKKADEEKLTKAKADNCTRARQAKAAFDSGKPITQSNAQGERIFLDEAGRTAESKRIDGIIAADCKR